MLCPYCKYDTTKVVETREVDTRATRRRRECLLCIKRFTTYERIESVDLTVVKKGGSKEPFDRSKVLDGMRKALTSRPYEEEKLERIADEIEILLRKRKSYEVSSKDIGDMVLTRLKNLDPVAYMRFASVYQDFEDVKEFEDELKVLKKKK